MLDACGFDSVRFLGHAVVKRYLRAGAARTWFWQRINERSRMETHFEAMTPDSQDARERVKEDLHALMRDAEELLKATAGDMSEKAKQARTRLSEALEKARGTYRQLEEKTVAAARATDKVIREHPYESIGIAFGVGLLIGVLVARK
jgi:ElaB/YqjD/DUF883 family membrane-anchored ribosome-binding protein